MIGVDPGPAGGTGTGTGSGSGSGPLRAVLEAFDAGAVTPADAARRTGLDPLIVATAIEHLVRIGRLHRQPMTSACPASGCAGCSLPVGCTTPAVPS